MRLLSYSVLVLSFVCSGVYAKDELPVDGIYIRQIASEMGQYDEKSLETRIVGKNATGRVFTAGKYSEISTYIAKFVTYPQKAVEKGQEGFVLVRFRINETGQLRLVIIERSSGYELLDNAALEAVKHANPIPKFSEIVFDKKHKMAEFIVPLKFQLP